MTSTPVSAYSWKETEEKECVISCPANDVSLNSVLMPEVEGRKAFSLSTASINVSN